MLSFSTPWSALQLFCWGEICLTNSSSIKCNLGSVFWIQQLFFCLHLYIDNQCLIVPKWGKTSLKKTRSSERLGENSGCVVLQHLKTSQSEVQRLPVAELPNLTSFSVGQKFSLVTGPRCSPHWRWKGCLAHIVQCIIVRWVEQARCGTALAFPWEEATFWPWFLCHRAGQSPPEETLTGQ